MSGRHVEGILTDCQDGVGVVTISHPGMCNALSLVMWADLAHAVTVFSEDPGVGVIVIRGEGADFSSGANIHDLPEDPRVFRDLHLAAENAIAEARKPVLAAVRGHCVGGGCGIAVACDLRFADGTAVFGITASRLGIVYPELPTRRLVHLLGPGTARRMLYGGELFDVAWAQRVGLVDEITDGDVDAVTMDFARLLLTRSRSTIAVAKQIVAGGQEPAMIGSRITQDYLEGVEAFRQSRDSRFPSAPDRPALERANHRLGPVDALTT